MGPAARQEHDREIEEARVRAQAEEAQRPAELKRWQAEAEKAAKQAREVERKAIYERYEPTFTRLAQVPHFAFFWLIGTLLRLVVLSLLSDKDISAGLFLFSAMFGLIPAIVLREHARDTKKRSKPYRDAEAARDAEISALERRTVASTAAPASVTTVVPPIAPILSLGVLPSVDAARTKSGEVSAQPSWLAAAAAPRTTSSPDSRSAAEPADSTLQNDDNGPMPSIETPQNGSQTWSSARCPN